MWDKIKTQLHQTWDTGTILWSRIKVILGVVWTAVTQSGVDLSTIITNPKYLLATKVAAAILLADGIFSETVRRRNATDL